MPPAPRVSSAPVIAAGKRQREPAGRAGDVASRIERAVNQTKQPARSVSRSRTRSSLIRPGSCAFAASCCAHRRNEVPRDGSDGTWPPAIASHAAARSGTRMRHDTPSTDKMMDAQQQPPGRIRTRIEPNRLHHHARRRSKPALGGARLLANAGAQRTIVEPPNIDPTQTVASKHRTRRRDLQVPLARPPMHTRSRKAS